MKLHYYRNLIVIMLCLVAGIVDVIGYLNLGHVFTANMTGNIIIMGMALGNLHTVSFVNSSLAFAGFILGNAAARLMLGPGKPSGSWSPRMTMLLVLQLVLFIVFAVLAQEDVVPVVEYALIVLLSFTMGTQTTTARRLGVAGISTTVLTNNMANVIEDVTALIQRKLRPHAQDESSCPAVDTMLRLMAILIYLIGAVIATVIELRYPLMAIWVPIVVMVILIVMVWAVFRKN